MRHCEGQAAARNSGVTRSTCSAFNAASKDAGNAPLAASGSTNTIATSASAEVIAKQIGIFRGDSCGSDMGQPRTRAKHLAALKGGGAACVNAHNPNGDCEVNCSAVPRDSLEDFKAITKILSEPFDYVSVHDYGCYPPFAEFSFCNGDNTSTAPLQAAKEVADEMGKPLFVGEFGSPECNIPGGPGWSSEECLAFPRKLLDYQVQSGIQLSNAWTWCQRKGDGFCINDGKGSETILSLLQAADKKLNSRGANQ